MAHNAKAYSAFNKPQYDSGCDFARSLQISEGDRVLDMGCGTGEITNVIASLVGPHGDVVGVDPDEARIKIAREEFKDVKNLQFVVGDSSSKLPHDNQDYYDLHFSSNAFHWCVGEGKKTYIEKAFQCLKPQGRLAIQTALKQEHTSWWNKQIPGLDIITLAENKELFESSLFTNIKTEMQPISSYFPNMEQYKSWLRATTHRGWEEISPESRDKALKELTKTAADGSITVEIPNATLRLVADKP